MMLRKKTYYLFIATGIVFIGAAIFNTLEREIEILNETFDWQISDTLVSDLSFKIGLICIGLILLLIGIVKYFKRKKL